MIIIIEYSFNKQLYTQLVGLVHWVTANLLNFAVGVSQKPAQMASWISSAVMIHNIIEELW